MMKYNTKYHKTRKVKQIYLKIKAFIKKNKLKIKLIIIKEQ